MKYRKKPVVIEAVQLVPGCEKEMAKHIPRVKVHEGIDVYKSDFYYMEIYTLEGTHRANKGDWIIKGVKGEFYPCKPDIFEATYDKVE